MNLMTLSIIALSLCWLNDGTVCYSEEQKRLFLQLPYIMSKLYSFGTVPNKVTHGSPSSSETLNTQSVDVESRTDQSAPMHRLDSNNANPETVESITEDYTDPLDSNIPDGTENESDIQVPSSTNMESQIDLATNDGDQIIKPLIDVSRLPASLLAKTLNAISQQLNKNTVKMSISTAKLLERSLKRFEQILTILERRELSGNIDDMTINKVHIRTILERIRTAKLQFSSTKSNLFKLLSVMTGKRYSNLASCECLQIIAETLTRYAMLLYGDIPNLSFDEDGVLCVHGNHFPTRKEVQQCIKTKNLKRKRHEFSNVPAAKRRRKDPNDLISLTSRINHNVKLLVRMYNYIANHTNMCRIDNIQSITTITPHLIKGLNTLIDSKSSEGLMSADIHNAYPVNMDLLKRVKSFMAENTEPLGKQTLWFLKAFNVPQAESMDRVDALYTLGQWYAAVAMSIIESIDNVRYEDGQVLVDGEPFLPKLIR